MQWSPSKLHILAVIELDVRSCLLYVEKLMSDSRILPRIASKIATLMVLGWMWEEYPLLQGVWEGILPRNIFTPEMVWEPISSYFSFKHEFNTRILDAENNFQ